MSRIKLCLEHKGKRANRWKEKNIYSTSCKISLLAGLTKIALIIKYMQRSRDQNCCMFIFHEMWSSGNRLDYCDNASFIYRTHMDWDSPSPQCMLRISIRYCCQTPPLAPTPSPPPHPQFSINLSQQIILLHTCHDILVLSSSSIV